MILPIFAYGQPVLKKVAPEVPPEYPGLDVLIANMWETMDAADGVGLAAPQIGLSLRLFVIDTTDIERKGPEKVPTDAGFKRVFINAMILEETGEPWNYEEGCLSIPRIRGDVERPDTIRIQWLDENFDAQDAIFTGINARVIQHEYDHIQGVLFTERLKPLKKRLIQRKLEEVRTGKVNTDYKMRFFNLR